ncbi:MAG: LysM peptidoglycan-binding domain-containing protein [Caulobacterales bacterium]|nr:LysM peptidoglycan-binding domain-containing protein [Caulobacterales bacterium]
MDTSYVSSIANRTASQGTGAFNNGSSSSTSFADFDLAYDALNSYAQGSDGGMYVVQTGDTLQSIAANL